MVTALLLALLGHAPAPFVAEGDAWVAAALGHRVVSLPDGALVLEGVFPLRFEVESVRRDRAPCRTDRLARTQQPRGLVTHRRCGLDETWTAVPEGLEHELTLQAPPAGAGPLRVRLAVQGPWHHRDEGGHVFAGPGGEGLRYGNAFLVRGDRRFPLEVQRVEGALELIIPAAWVDAPGAFPLHIDPLLTLSTPAAFPGPTGGGNLATEPAIAFSPTVGLVVWVDDLWGGSDLYGALIDGEGTILVSGLPLVVGRASHHKPALVWNGASFTLAWEQPGSNGGLSVWHLNVNLEGRPLTAPREIVLAQAPSLAALRDGGVLLAWGSHCTAQVAPLDTAQSTTTSTGCEIARTALSTWDDAWFLAVEKSLSGGVSTVSGYLSLDGGMPALPVVLPNFSLTSTDFPAVLMTSRNEALFFWRQGTEVLGAQCGTTVCAELSTRFDSTTVALTMTRGGSPVLGLMVDAGAVISAQSLSVDAGAPAKLSEGGYSTQMALAATPEADGGAVIVVWTDHHTSDHIHFSRFDLAPPSAQVEATLTQLPLPQTQPQVALSGSRGLVVWREGEDVLRAADVVWSPGPLAKLGTPFLLSERTRVGRVDLASSPSGDAMVAWLAPTVGGVTVELQAVSGTTLGTRTSYFAGPVVSAGPVVAFNGASFLMAFATGTTVEVVQLSPALPLSLPGGGRVSELELACVAGVCAAAWATDLGVSVQRLDGATVRMGPGLHPALSHDGQRLHLAWDKGSAFGTATLELDGGTWTPGADVVPAVPVTVRRLELAPGTPPVMAWAGVTAAGAERVWVRGAGQIVERSGQAPDLATTGLDQPNGVLVFERPLGGSYWDTRTAAVAFGWPSPDAGAADAGLLDAGTSPDAGASGNDGGTDGGADGGEAGPLLFHPTGCGCSTTPSLGLLGLFWLLISLARRRPHHA